MSTIQHVRPFIAEPPVADIPSHRAVPDTFIAVDPDVRELTPADIVASVRTYVALALCAAGLFVAARLALMLVARWYRDNVSPVTKIAADRHSLRQAHKQKKDR